jgi:hypothetical protein
MSITTEQREAVRILYERRGRNVLAVARIVDAKPAFDEAQSEFAAAEAALTALSEALDALEVRLLAGLPGEAAQ